VATWLKAEILASLQAQRPGVDTLTSTINQRNTPMLRVSTALGFRETWGRHLVAIGL